MILISTALDSIPLTFTEKLTGYTQRIPKVQVDGEIVILQAWEIHKKTNADTIVHKRSLLI